MLKLASVYVTSHMIYEARLRAPGNRTPLKNLVNHNHINTFRNKITAVRSTSVIRKKKVVMAYIHKKNSRWHVDIRKKGFPSIYKSFLDLKDARKFARDVESQMERNVFEDYSGASGTTLKEILIKYRDENKLFN